MINYKNDKESGASSKSEAFTASGTYQGASKNDIFTKISMNSI
jgi:hypothetical protein